MFQQMYKTTRYSLEYSSNLTHDFIDRNGRWWKLGLTICILFVPVLIRATNPDLISLPHHSNCSRLILKVAMHKIIKYVIP